MNSIFDGVEALTFDCYGTIIDWESGILQAARPLLGLTGDGLEGGSVGRGGASPRGGARRRMSDGELLELFGRLEPAAERPPFRSYREVLTEVATGMGEAVGWPVSPEAAARFADSVPGWPPFLDSRDALGRLATKYRLAIVSNVDDDLFAGTAEHLGVTFDAVVTAQQVGCYKPEPDHFREVLERLELPVGAVVHVAQSLYHDIRPAKALGFTCTWVDRRTGRSGSGATPPAEAEPDLVVPDLATLALEAGA